MTRSRQTADWGSRAGLAKIVPSSVAVGSGTGSANVAGTVTFSGVSSVSLNGVFSATYTNYKILLNVSAAGGGTSISARLRSAGTDNTSSNYNRQYLVSAGTSTFPSRLTSTTSWDVLGLANGTSKSCVVVEVANPFVTEYTSSVVQSSQAPEGGSIEWFGCAFGMTVTTSYDSITFFPATGGRTLTGDISVYGYTQ